MSSWLLVIAILVGVGIGVVIERRFGAHAPASSIATKRSDAAVFHDLLAGASLHVDLYVPKPGERPSPWMVFVHERGWPAPDDKERSGAGIADAMQRRGIAVAVISFDPTEARPLAKCSEDVALAVKELSTRAAEYGLVPEPVLAGDELGAALVTSLALDAHYGLPPAKLRGVIAMNGVFDDAPPARADAPPFLVLSAHGDSPKSAQSSRALARALERAGAKQVHGYHASSRDARSLANLSGERNEVGDLVAAFVRGETTTGGPEGTWALSDLWGARAPLSSEPFWADARLVVRRPTDTRFRAEVRNVFGEMMRDLEPWPALSYDAIDLADYLGAHPEVGNGDFLEITNVRGEKLVLTRSEIAQKKPQIVIGIDDERNLFRLFVTYNVHRTYSWKPETAPRPLLVRNIGAFLFVPNGEGLKVVTLANFALTTSSFKMVAKDPLAVARSLPKPAAAALTNEQGCLQCHALHGDGARAHHLRASDGKLAEGFGLALEEYPPEVLHRFLFEQEAVSKSFGVTPLLVKEPAATQLIEAAR